MRRALYYLVSASCIAYAIASSGDRSRDFRACVARCQSRGCSQQSLSLILKLTRWTCEDDCKYFCMHDITERAIETGGRIQQYYGKWPFWRFWGMQEPASVFFSVLNFLAHLDGLYVLKEGIQKSHPMRRFYMIWSITSMNTWVWSAVFHTRDKPLTEKLDYFSAALTILTGLYLTVIRLFHLYPDPFRTRLTSSYRNPHPRALVLYLWSILCLLVFIGHVSYLSLLPRFNYSYNMLFNVLLGMTHNVLWLLYALPPIIPCPIQRFPSQPRSYRPDFVGRVAILIVLTTAATALELLDFPPILRTIDAHSLWHLATACIAPFWYQFLAQDSLDPSWRVRKA